MTTIIRPSGTKPIARRGVLLSLALALLVAGVVSPAARGTTLFWFGAQDNNWTTVGNWGTSTVADNSLPADGDTLRWIPGRATANLSMNNDYVGLTVAQINLLGGSASPAGIVFNGNKLGWTGYIDSTDSGIIYNLPLEAADTWVEIHRGGTFNGVISEAIAGTLVDFRTGSISLTAPNTWTGPSRLSTTVSVPSLANKATPQPLGQGDIEFGYLSVASSTSGTLVYSGPATTTDKGFMIGRNFSTYESRTNAFLNNGTGAVTWAGPQNKATANTYPQTFRLGGTNTGNNDWQSNIANNSASSTIGIIKTKAGKWILSGNNTYTGPTTVSAGTLVVSGTHNDTAGGYTIDGPGTLEVSGASALLTTPTLSLAGDVSLLGGTLQLTQTPAVGLSFSGGALDFNGGALALPYAANGGNPWDLTDLLGISGSTITTFGGTTEYGKMYFVPGTGSFAGYTLIFAVPEPSLLLLLASGGAVLIGQRRRGKG